MADSLSMKPVIRDNIEKEKKGVILTDPRILYSLFVIW